MSEAQRPRRSDGGTRLSRYDNAKYFLICSVVIGHLLKPTATSRRAFARSLLIFIYSFHMPLFVFISGLFLSRRSMTWEKVRARALRYFVLGVAMDLIRTYFPVLLGESAKATPLFVVGGLPWFMFALSAYHVLAWVLRDWDFVSIGVASLALALVAGYVSSIGDFLCLSRIIVFFPFFWLGHVLSPQDVEGFLTSRGTRKAGVVVICAFALLCLAFPHQAYPWRKLFMGRYGYAEVGIGGCFALHRLLAYAVSLLMSAAVLCAMPVRRIEPLTTWGTRTLQVYIVHHEIIDMLRSGGVVLTLVKAGEWGWLALIPLGVGLASLISLPDVAGIIARLRAHRQVRT